MEPAARSDAGLWAPPPAWAQPPKMAAAVPNVGFLPVTVVDDRPEPTNIEAELSAPYYRTGWDHAPLLADLLKRTQLAPVQLLPANATGWLRSALALRRSGNNVYREPLLYTMVQLVRVSDVPFASTGLAHARTRVTTELRVHLYFANHIYDIHADYDLWNVMENMVPHGEVQRCPPRPTSVAAELRAAQLEGRAPAVSSALIRSNVPPRLAARPELWFTVGGLLKLVESSTYAEATQPAGLTVELRSYQRMTLAWMIDQETRPGGINAAFWERRTTSVGASTPSEPSVTPATAAADCRNATRGGAGDGGGGTVRVIVSTTLSADLTSTTTTATYPNAPALNTAASSDASGAEGDDGFTFYYCPLAGEVALTPPPAMGGGFVCEEMGLGKTVEALALILARRPPRDASSRATLVVVPATLLDQWQMEIEDRVAPGTLAYYVFKSSAMVRDGEGTRLPPARYGYRSRTAAQIAAAASRRAAPVSARHRKPLAVSTRSVTTRRRSASLKDTGEVNREQRVQWEAVKAEVESAEAEAAGNEDEGPPSKRAAVAVRTPSHQIVTSVATAAMQTPSHQTVTSVATAAAAVPKAALATAGQAHSLSDVSSPSISTGVASTEEREYVVVAPGGVPLFSGPGQATLYHIARADEAYLSEPQERPAAYGCIPSGRLAAGTRVVLTGEFVTVHGTVWGRLCDPPPFSNGQIILTAAARDAPECSPSASAWAPVRHGNAAARLVPVALPAADTWELVPLTPEALSTFDIVLTTYDDLAAGSRASRRRTALARTAHILRRTPWYRVMLDESQRLHNSRAVVTQAAQDLQREYSWLLSGTPAGNVVHDLVGQLLFLGVEPWCRMGNNVHNFWDKEIAARWEEHDAEILDTLHTLLAHVMMRHSKSQTINGQPILTLPPRVIRTELVDFASASEKYVYTVLERQLRLQLKQQSHMAEGPQLRELQAVFRWLVGLSSHTATLDLLDFDRFLARSGERVRMESIIDGITVITGIPALEVRDNLRSIPNYSPYLLLKARGYDEKTIADILAKLQQSYGLTATSVSATYMLENLPAYVQGSHRNHATLELLHHLTQRNCLADRQRLRRCQMCVTNLRCPICQYAAVDPCVTPCLHVYCTKCIVTCLELSGASTAHRGARGECPMCKRALVVDQLVGLCAEQAMDEPAESIRPTPPDLSSVMDHTTKSFETFYVDDSISAIDLTLTQTPTARMLRRVYVNGVREPADSTRALVIPHEDPLCTSPAETLMLHGISGTVVVERGVALYEPGQHTRFEPDAPSIDGAFLGHYDYACDELGPKVTRTLALITQWRQEVPDTKIIVYGTHKATLRKLAYALALHLDPRLETDNIYVHSELPAAKRMQALRRFRVDPDSYVLLLSTQTHHAGLTLTVATKLILLDIAPSATMEKQLISRVHRIGQTRPVEVVRLVLQGTVEESLYRRRWTDALGKQPAAAQGTAGPLGQTLENGDEDSAAAAAGEAEPLGEALESGDEDGDEDGDEVMATPHTAVEMASETEGLTVTDMLALLSHEEAASEPVTTSDYTDLV